MTFYYVLHAQADPHFIMGIWLGICMYLRTTVISLHGHGLALLRSLTEVDYRIPRVVRNPDTRVVHIVHFKPYGGVLGVPAIPVTSSVLVD